MTPVDIVKAGLASRAGQRMLGLRAPRQGIVVLTYHRVTAQGDAFDGTAVDEFRRQMQWLKAHCELLSPRGLEQVVQAPPRRRPAVLVTFDDGYRCHYTNAYPVLDELRIEHVVFLATRFMDEGGLIWTDEVSCMVRHTRAAAVRLPWDARSWAPLDTPAARRRFELACKAYLKRVADERRRELQQALGEQLQVDAARLELPRQMMSWDEVRATGELACHGGHTHSHPILSRLPAGQVEREIRLCSARIAQETGRAPALFAYPNGGADDFTQHSKNVLAQCGFTHAFTTMEGRYGPGMDRWAIPRQSTGCATLGDFAWLVQGC